MAFLGDVDEKVDSGQRLVLLKRLEKRARNACAAVSLCVEDRQLSLLASA